MVTPVRLQPFVIAAAVCALLQALVSGGSGYLLGKAIADTPSPDPFAAPPSAPPPPSSEPPSPEPTEPSEPPAAGYAEPRGDRPVVRLRFDVADDLASVTGSETVVFTPDLRVCELVFRLWPNKPETALAGNELSVSTATVDGVEVTPVIEATGAPEGSTGTLVELPIAGCAEPGQQVTAELEFALLLGQDTPERVGWSAEESMAWFATAFPLLAWEHGVGWMRNPAVELFGETVGSESFRLELLEVVAPDGLEVMGTGELQGTTDVGSSGRTAHAFSADAVRDVAVVVGELEVSSTEVDGTAVHVAVPAVGSVAGVDVWEQASAESLALVSGYLGSYPYTDLWMTVVPDFPTGVEFPGAIFYGDVDPAEFIELVPHETAHMWLYGLVGNNQGRDPWLDEGITSYVEAHVLGFDEFLLGQPVPAQAEGYLGASMQFWATMDPTGDLYGAGVYGAGASTMADARAASDPEAFDASLRAYVSAQAYQIATPEDLRQAFGSVPEALAVLEDAGAFAGDAGDP